MAQGFNVTTIGPNLRDQSKGTMHAHVTGCADIKRSYKGVDRHEFENHISPFNTRRQLVEDIFGDFIFANDENPWEDYVGEIYFAPCLEAMPLDA